MSYPEVIEVNGVEHEINTGYEYALACFACINDEDITDTERAYGVIGLLYVEPPEDLEEALNLAIKYLRCGKENEEEEIYYKPDMDFDKDMHYIRSSFRSDYGIDLTHTEHMHWWEFIELLQGLTDNCILNRIRDLRNYDTSTIKDPKTKQRILKAQRGVALPEKLSQEDQDMLDSFYSQLK